ncbi:MAG: hypothetical protein ACYCZB_06095 [Acidiphilium sp.]
MATEVGRRLHWRGGSRVSETIARAGRGALFEKSLAPAGDVAGVFRRTMLEAPAKTGAVLRHERGANVAAPAKAGRVPVRDIGAVPTHEMTRWFGALFADEARRPPSGVTGFDGRLSPIFPGRKPGF